MYPHLFLETLAARTGADQVRSKGDEELTFIYATTAHNQAGATDAVYNYVNDVSPVNRDTVTTLSIQPRAVRFTPPAGWYRRAIRAHAAGAIATAIAFLVDADHASGGAVLPSSIDAACIAMLLGVVRHLDNNDNEDSGASL